MGWNASRWLSEVASRGYCATTRGAGNCRNGLQGSFGLATSAQDSWLAAADWCLAMCEQCERCNYIDVSIRHADCSWHHACDQESLRTDVHQVLSGPALRTLSRQRTLKKQTSNQLDLDTFETVSRKRYTATACTRGERDGGNHTIRITAWSGMGTGFNVVAGTFALHRAACCGGSAILPGQHSEQSWRKNQQTRGHHGHMALHELLGARERTCLSFRHVRVVATEDLCKPTRKDAFAYFQDGAGVACPSAQYYWRPALVALLAYVDLYSALPACPTSVDFDNTLVAHVRSGDIFTSDTHVSYGQPPLAFYLSAWADSNLTNLLIVTENYASPVVRVLHMLQKTVHRGKVSVQAGGADEFKRDLGTLMCAKYLVASKSSLTMLLLTNPRLKMVYSSSVAFGMTSERVPIWTASCKTVIRTAENLERASFWKATDRQKLSLAEGSWKERIQFTESKAHCLSLTANTEGGDQPEPHHD